MTVLRGAPVSAKARGAEPGSKPALRRRLLARRDRIAAPERAARSGRILRRLLALPEYRRARWVGLYCAFRSEVATATLLRRALREGKRVAVPMTIWRGRSLVFSEVRDPERDLIPGTQGIPEPRPDALRPVAVEALDLLIVPGVGFDLSGHRLGYGMGFYDRLFHRLPGRVPRVALAFECQVMTALPAGKQDQPVDVIVTEERVIRISKPGVRSQE
ncbi:MAG: 5-formyltetrahydrofolate cyclo-ligase [Nitrospirae bacterium]|nr:5-formyltetrahydrofolate cyclo-ligase [Nitrospirota bacterium]